MWRWRKRPGMRLPKKGRYARRISRASRQRWAVAVLLHSATNSPNRRESSALETLISITFEEKGGKTVQTFHQRPFLNAERRDSHLGGWTSAFDKLAAYAAQIAKERSA